MVPRVIENDREFRARAYAHFEQDNLSGAAEGDAALSTNDRTSAMIFLVAYLCLSPKCWPALKSADYAEACNIFTGLKVSKITLRWSFWYGQYLVDFEVGRSFREPHTTA